MVKGLLHYAVVPMVLEANEYGILRFVRPDGTIVATTKQTYLQQGTFDFALSHMSTEKELEVQVYRGKVEPWYPFARPIDFIRDEIRHRLAWLYRREEDEEEWDD